METQERAAAVASEVEALAMTVEGTVGVAAKHLASGEEIAYNADLVFPTASVFKLPLLFELFRQVEAGTIDLARRVELTAQQRVAGSGVLQDLDPGLNPTIRDLAVLMVVVSDNMATDLLLEMVGRESVTRTMSSLGLTRTRVPFSTRELLFHMTGMDPAGAGTYDENRARLRGWKVVQENRAVSDESDVSTPREMCRLLEIVARGQVLSTGSCTQIVDIMQRQKYKELIPLRLPAGTEVANKTGRLNGVRNDVGIVYGPTGPYVLALFSRNVRDELRCACTLGDISLRIYRHFNG